MIFPTVDYFRDFYLHIIYCNLAILGSTYVLIVCSNSLSPLLSVDLRKILPFSFVFMLNYPFPKPVSSLVKILVVWGDMSKPANQRQCQHEYMHWKISSKSRYVIQSWLFLMYIYLEMFWNIDRVPEAHNDQFFEKSQACTRWKDFKRF